MGLKEYLLSKQNIYLAIYAVKSYVFEPQLLSKEDKELLNDLSDPFNEEVIENTIRSVKEILTQILDQDDYFFQVQVYYMPKDYKDNKPIYRPIHTAGLYDLISMVSLLHVLIYEIPDKGKNWKLHLSNYSRLMPNNFYGNRISKRPEELFKRWNVQYKKFTQKANDFFKTYHESKEYKYEIKLDLKNFFPSVNPLIVYNMLMNNMPVTLKSSEDIDIFKQVIYKLLICKVTNLRTARAKEMYYGDFISEGLYTRGLAQGLPQSYFFGNIVMIEISKQYDKYFEASSVFYVDDSYLYSNCKITDTQNFERQIEELNHRIENMEKRLKEAREGDSFIREKVSIIDDRLYGIYVHNADKSSYTLIQDTKEGEIYLRALSREASQIGTDMGALYSEEEEETLLYKARVLLTSIEKTKEKEKNNIGYIDKLERYYKYFKYREMKLALKTEKEISKKIFDVLIDDLKDANIDEYYNKLDGGLDKENFFEKYKNDIWKVAITLLINNTVYEEQHEHIRKYISSIISDLYGDELLECSYIKKMYQDYLNNVKLKNLPDMYNTLRKETNKKMVHYANLNSDILKEEFKGVKLKELNSEILKSFGICSEEFISICSIVRENSDRLYRMFLNAIYSKLFKVILSEDIVISSYDKKGIQYGELRVLSFLRNNRFTMKKFENWQIDVMSADNAQKIDYTIFEVLGIYKKYVIEPQNIDDLIMVHKYTCDIWKNGAKHLYFYTLHNQEHAVDLVENIIKIIKAFSYIKISRYDYYLLFIACYLHDISMVRIASEKDFLLDNDESKKIVTRAEENWNQDKSQRKKKIVDIYKDVDNFFENKIRSAHAQDSAREIRTRKELDFLKDSVRECVAEIAESHMMETKDIYFLKGDANKRLINYKFNKILLRFADLLDMSKNRISRPILNHNIDNMSQISAFHWVSHLLTEGYTLVADYKLDDKLPDYLAPGAITENVTLSIYVNLSQFSKITCKKCEFGKIDNNTISNDGFEINPIMDESVCESEKCNFLCKWFNTKNDYLVQEMQALQKYLSRVPVGERFYNTEIIIKVIVANPTDISDEHFEVLKYRVN